MRAAYYERFGAADEVIEIGEVPTPTPGPGEALVRLETSGANPSDVRARAGGRPGVTEPPFPRIIPHSDGAGVIEAVGEGVAEGRVGERVWIWNGQWGRAFGTAAECIALPAEQAVALPEGVSFEVGAALGIPGLTACRAVLGGGAVAGKRVLVSGGAGSVGRLAVQVAAASGAQVIATARGAEAMQSVRAAGAEQVFDYSQEGLAEQILEATEGALIDRIVEVEFGANAETNAKVIAERGTIAAYGSAKDMTPTIPFYPLMFKAADVDLILVYIMGDEERAQTAEALTGLLERGALDFQIDRVEPLDACAAVHDAIAAGERRGAVILKVAGS